MFKEGHEGAFVFIYQKYLQDIFNYGNRFCHDRELIKDCIQELFIELRKSNNLANTDAIKPYLFKALRLKILGELRKNKGQANVIQNAASYKFDIELSIETKIINSQIDKEKKLKLKKALTILTKKQQELLHYFYIEGFSYLQITDIMGFNNIKSVRNLLYKSIKRIRKEI